MKKLSIALLLVMLLSGCSASKTEESTSFFALDTIVEITITASDAKPILEEVESEIARLEALWSVTNPDSDISKINQSNGESVEVAPETIAILEYAVEMSEKTNGILEPTIYPIVKSWGFTTDANRVPSQEEIDSLLAVVDYRQIQITNTTVTVPADVEIDLGAVGKGYISYCIENLLADYDISSGIINLGGNIRVIGKKTDTESWRIGIQSPMAEGNLGIFTCNDKSIVTSGGYERYFVGEDGTEYIHIIDPTTGYPVISDLQSVSIIGDDSRMSDALSTSLFIMGVEDAITYYQENEGFDFILLSTDNKIYISEDIVNDFTLNAMYSDIEIVTVTR